MVHDALREEFVMKDAGTVSKTIESVDAGYVHIDKYVEPEDFLKLSDSSLKWYNIAPADRPVPREIYDLALGFLKRESNAGNFDQLGEFGFVILHRCGDDFYFLLVNSWRNANEVWESVFAKRKGAEHDFSSFDFDGAHRGTFCVWELAAVWHEAMAWKRFLRTSRDAESKNIYLQDAYRGPA